MVTRMSRRALNRRAVLLGGVAGAAFVALPVRHSVLASSATVLRAAPAEAQVLPSGEPATRVWAYDGQVPGPPVRVRRGDIVRVRLDNGLPQPTTIHWHGVRIDNRMDGVPGLTQEPVPPGETFEYAFAVPDAGTFWYHPHSRSWEQQARGLYGLLIVEEDEPPRFDQDVALVLDDWRIDEAGQIHEASFGHMMDWSHAGRLGNLLTTNGLDSVDVPVRAGERVRLRLCNTSNARTLRIRIDDHTPMVIALDGQPVAPFAPAGGEIVLASGQRTDLSVDMILNPGARAAIAETSGREAVAAATLTYHDDAVAREQPLDAPIALAPNPLPDSIDIAGALDVDLVMQGGAMGGLREAQHKGETKDIRTLVESGLVWALNGVAGRPETPLFDVPRGRPVRIRMVNETAWPHAMHLHGHHFRELAGPNKSVYGPWRDTLLVDRRSERTVVLLADNPGDWLLHCHMLEHHAAGMVTWFRVGA